MTKWTKWIAAVFIAVSVLTYTAIAEAHVTVWPKQSTAGTWENTPFAFPLKKM